VMMMMMMCKLVSQMCVCMLVAALVLEGQEHSS